MGRLVLIRHGQSVWNAENRFTGWTDVDLSDRGVEEAREAGDLSFRDTVRCSPHEDSRGHRGQLRLSLVGVLFVYPGNQG